MAFTKLVGTGWEMGSVEIVESGNRTIYAVIDSTEVHTGTYSLGTWSSTKYDFPVDPGDVSTALYVGCWIKSSISGSLHRLGVKLTDGYATYVEFDGTAYNAYREGNLLENGTVSVNFDEWHLVEIYVLIDNSGGRVITKIDGQDDIDFTGDTQPASVSQIEFAHIRGSTSGFNGTYFDDISVGTGGWPGDIRYDLLTVTSDDGTNEWDPSTGTDHYAVIDEIPPSDSDYLSTTVDSEEELFGCSNWDGTGKEPLDLVVWVRAAKDEADAHEIELTIKEGASQIVSSAKPLLTSYEYAFNIFTTAPDTTAWDDTHVDNVVIGFRSVIV